MNKINIYQVDAFTDELFSGNPAAICPLDNWLEDDQMQAIAAENNLAETAFIIDKGEHVEIRWFTPAVEVDLCGHATLASAFVLLNCLNYDKELIRFHSLRSGELSVSKKDNLLFLDFPTDKISRCHNQTPIARGIGIEPIEVYKGLTDFIAIVANEGELRNIKPNFAAIVELDARGLVVSAKGDQVDFVSRFFAPQSGIDEDPVTGSAHTSLIPIWADKLGKKEMSAKQISKRGGDLICSHHDDRCKIGGSARLYLSGEIFIK